MKLSGDPLSAAGRADRAWEGASPIPEMELPAVELERHGESSSESLGSDLLKISVK
jgi:hypothetical protein